MTFGTNYSIFHQHLYAIVLDSYYQIAKFISGKFYSYELNSSVDNIYLKTCDCDFDLVYDLNVYNFDRYASNYFTIYSDSRNHSRSFVHEDQVQVHFDHQVQVQFVRVYADHSVRVHQVYDGVYFDLQEHHFSYTQRAHVPNDKFLHGQHNGY